MKATVETVRQIFTEWNRRLFREPLPDIEIRIGRGTKTLGAFRHPRAMPASRRLSDQCSITLSGHYDLPVELLTDIIIHEMIHYHIWIRGLEDNAPHGRLFRSIAAEINNRFNRSVTVRTRLPDGTAESVAKKRYKYICVSIHINGYKYVTNCARTRIFNIDKELRCSDCIVSHQWWLSADPWFDRFPRSLAARLYKTDEAELSLHLGKGAVRCQCVDGRFRFMQRHNDTTGT